MPNSVEFLKDPFRWFNWPICPVKRYVGIPAFIQCAIVIADNTPRCIEINMFALVAGPIGPQLKGKREYVYESFEDMVADGWEVD